MWPREWSSDVCSSDLRPCRFSTEQVLEGVIDFRIDAEDHGGVPEGARNHTRREGKRGELIEQGRSRGATNPDRRSEERRVGKACRSRGSKCSENRQNA